jgi:hypothetical protein
MNNSSYNAKPWHLINEEKYPRSSKILEKERFFICQECPSFNLGICKECGCFMKQKVKLELASCPLNKW